MGCEVKTKYKLEREREKLKWMIIKNNQMQRFNKLNRKQDNKK